ncbi:MAG TPA: signal peptidase II [Candidatus Hydrogenedentes bacterium]|nr:signal peptidase II [Candidatus Hydrogenedentota bacterium]HPG70023.1 signal peptidase II [Candidatus Hydrogenedentota bacterium]
MAIVLTVFAFIVCADQVTKAMVRAQYPETDFSFLREGPKLFRISHQHNEGLVGGMFEEKPPVAMAAPVLASLVLLYLFRHLDAKSKWQSLAYGLVAGGAVGNLIDRFRIGHVTDFLQFHFYFIPFDFPWKLFPAFNVADSAICTGVFLLVITWNAMPKHQDVPDTAKNRAA